MLTEEKPRQKAGTENRHKNEDPGQHFFNYWRMSRIWSSIFQRIAEKRRQGMYDDDVTIYRQQRPLS